MKVLNLYSGTGGNRALWENVQVTAVEINKGIADVYKKRFPNDNVIIADAHEYLLNNYSNFDFIWSSCPCQSHSTMRFAGAKNNYSNKPLYPDMKLYEEIIFLKHHFHGKYVVENVIPYYIPLIKPTAKIGRHLFWANFEIANIKITRKINVKNSTRFDLKKAHNIVNLDITGTGKRTDQILRNCVEGKLGLHILRESQRIGFFELKHFI